MDVSVIIVSYNASKYLKDCLDSIIKYTKNIDYEIIVVDNNSTDNAVEVAKSFGNKIKLIENKDNKGFGGGNNDGAKVAQGQYLLTLNPDTLFLENSLEKMFLWMEAHDDIAVSTGQLLDSEQKPLPNGGFFPTLPRLFFWAFFLDDLPLISRLISPYHPHIPYYPDKNDLSLDWIIGTFMFTRKAAWDQSGGFDPSIFMYGEDTELCYRFQELGWKIAYTPITRIIHHERQSSGGLPRNAILGEFRGLKFIYGKHFPGWQQIILGSILDVAAVNRIFLWLLRRNLEMVKLYLEALFL